MACVRVCAVSWVRCVQVVGVRLQVCVLMVWVCSSVISSCLLSIAWMM